MHEIKTQSDIDNGLKELLAENPDLKPAANVAGKLPLRSQKGGFDGLSRIIIGQQVSRASADAIHSRFIEHINPLTAEQFLDAGEPAWIEIGLSRAKQKAISGLADAIVSGELAIDDLHTLPAENAMSQLTALKGIGPWTAEVYLLFCAGHQDIFPAGDLALQEGVRVASNLDQRPTEKELRIIAAEWSPWRGIAARLFWTYYSKLKQGNKETLPL